MNKSNRRNNTSKTNGGVGRTSLTALLLALLLLCFSAAPSVARSPVPDTQQGSAGVWRELECDAKRKESALPDWNPMKKKHSTV